MTLKTRSWVKKRVKITGTWKIKIQKAGKRHLLMNKTKKAKKTDQYGRLLSGSEVKRVLRQLPHGIK
jgi:large subunit ribosomal protein L35